MNDEEWDLATKFDDDLWGTLSQFSSVDSQFLLDDGIQFFCYDEQEAEVVMEVFKSWLEEAGQFKEYRYSDPCLKQRFIGIADIKEIRRSEKDYGDRSVLYWCKPEHQAKAQAHIQEKVDRMREIEFESMLRKKQTFYEDQARDESRLHSG